MYIIFYNFTIFFLVKFNLIHAEKSKWNCNLWYWLLIIFNYKIFRNKLVLINNLIFFYVVISKAISPILKIKIKNRYSLNNLIQNFIKNICKLIFFIIIPIVPKPKNKFRRLGANFVSVSEFNDSPKNRNMFKKYTYYKACWTPLSIKIANKFYIKLVIIDNKPAENKPFFYFILSWEKILIVWK